MMQVAGEVIQKWALTTFCGGILAILIFPLRLAYRKTKATIETVAAIKVQLDLAVSNHLHTIEVNTGKSAEANTKMAEQLTSMNADNRELIGYIKGVIR